MGGPQGGHGCKLHSKCSKLARIAFDSIASAQPRGPLEACVGTLRTHGQDPRADSSGRGAVCPSPQSGSMSLKPASEAVLSRVDRHAHVRRLASGANTKEAHATRTIDTCTLLPSHGQPGRPKTPPAAVTPLAAGSASAAASPLRLEFGILPAFLPRPPAALRGRRRRRRRGWLAGAPGQADGQPRRCCLLLPSSNCWIARSSTAISAFMSACFCASSS